MIREHSDSSAQANAVGDTDLQESSLRRLHSETLVYRQKCRPRRSISQFRFLGQRHYKLERPCSSAGRVPRRRLFLLSGSFCKACCGWHKVTLLDSKNDVLGKEPKSEEKARERFRKPPSPKSEWDSGWVQEVELGKEFF